MISISDSLLTEIREHGVRDYPYECCGLLLGRYETDAKVVNETYPISNAREDLEVVGFYHSHPDSPAVPSQYDLEHAWPTYSYIIVSTSEGDSGDLFSWEQEADRSRFNQEEIILKG